MNQTDLLKILEEIHDGTLSPAAAAERLKHLPFEDIGFAKVDHHRALRQGYAEVIFGKGKTPRQVAEIVRVMANKKSSTENILITRADAKIFAGVKSVPPRANFPALSRLITIARTHERLGQGSILVGSAGPSHIPVAEEAVLTARMMGNRVEQLFDVGVAGIHRLLEHRLELAEARVIICTAGMEGALPSVVGGLVGVP